MSLENRKDILDLGKGILWLFVVITGYLAMEKFSTIDTKLDKLDHIESRLIRVEYELRLK